MQHTAAAGAHRCPLSLLLRHRPLGPSMRQRLVLLCQPETEFVLERRRHLPRTSTLRAQTHLPKCSVPMQ